MQQEYIKGSCEKCEESIEFPAQGLGQAISCPHCGENTNLLEVKQDAENPPAPPRKRSKSILLIGLSCAALATAMGLGIFAASKSAKRLTQVQATPEIKITDEEPKVKRQKKPAARRAKAASSVAFELNGLEASDIALEKSESSRLIYATGTVRNKSDRQRFGVKVDLDLLDEQGVKIGSATDYIQVVEPRKDWRFRAMVTEPKAASVKITALTED